MKFIGNFTDSMKDYCLKKMERLQKYTDITDAVITYQSTKQKDNNFKLEIGLGNNIRAAKTGPDFYALVIDVIEKLDGQIRKYRTTNIFNKRRSDIKDFESNDEYESIKLSKEKFLILEGMSIEEAIDEMDLLDHDFFIYKDIDRNDNICVVYKRFDNTYGVIETR